MCFNVFYVVKKYLIERRLVLSGFVELALLAQNTSSCATNPDKKKHGFSWLLLSDDGHEAEDDRCPDLISLLVVLSALTTRCSLVLSGF